MRNEARAGLLIILLALLAFALIPRARAAAGITLIGQPSVENQFPNALVFSLEAQSEAEIQDIRLRYTFIPDNRPATAQPEFTRGAKVQAAYTLRSGTRQVYIPPGKTIRYSWELRDAAGNELKTEEYETTFADTRFQWQQVTDGHINLFYYKGTQRDAEVMAQIANESVNQAAALLGASIDFPIKIWAYADPKDFQIALAHQSVTQDPGVLGQAHDPDTFIMVVDRLSSPTALDTARHELTHLVTANALRGGPYKDLYPSWLNEGTSVFLQVSPNDVGYIEALENAIREDKVMSVKGLQAARNRDIGLFYGQSYSIVKYLVETHGAAKFAQLINEFKRNGSVDESFTNVYGFDQDGLTREWRKSVGLPETQRVQDSPPASGNPRAGSDNGAPVVLIAGAAVVLVLLAVAAGAGGFLLARRARAGGIE